MCILESTAQKTVIIGWTGTDYGALATYKIGDAEQKQSRALISILEAERVHRLVIDDVRDIRQALDVGPTTNQKVQQWFFGSVRHKLTFKAERGGMHVALQEESYTSRRKELGLGRVVGGMAPPTGIRYVAGVSVAQRACAEKPPSL
jgi:IS605 OrfB family transposase